MYSHMIKKLPNRHCFTYLTITMIDQLENSQHVLAAHFR